MKYFNLFKKYFPFFYIVLLISSFFYIRHILNVDKISVGKSDTSEEDKTEIEIKPVEVTLIIENNNTVDKTYTLRLKNINTFDDFLEQLVEDKKLFFEKTQYIYGTEYDLINRTKAPEGYIWKIYKNDIDITYRTKDINLTDGDIFKISLEKNETIRILEPR